MATLTLGGRDFAVSPTIGHCKKLRAIGLDVVKKTGEAFAELLTDEEKFVTALYTLVEDQLPDDERFSPEMFPFLFDGETWHAATAAIKDGFADFFQARQDRQRAAMVRRMFDAGEAATDAVAEELDRLDISAMKRQIAASLNLNESVASAISDALQPSTHGEPSTAVQDESELTPTH